MTQEEKQLLLKDLCARLPYNVMIECSINSGESMDAILVPSDITEFVEDSIMVKPYLRSLSNMTEKEYKEWQLYKGSIVESCDEKLEEKINALHDWFNSRHLDWRGLIPKGLALEAPKDMYK